MKPDRPHMNSLVFIKILALCLCLAGIMAGACIPFLYESQSLYYKFGMDKALLQWGKAAGLIAVVLMLYQVILMSRFQVLEPAVTRKSLAILHKALGKFIGVLVLLHPLLILGADGFVFFPMEKRYWPEFLGVFLLVFILAMVAMSLWRGVLKIPYKVWQRLHRFSAPLVVLLGFIHLDFVSESFGSGPPRAGLTMAMVLALVLFAKIYVNRFFKRRSS